MLKHLRQQGGVDQASGQLEQGAIWTTTPRHQATMPPRPSSSHHSVGYASPARYPATSKASQPPPPPPLHVSMLNASKHSLSPAASVSPGTGGNQTKTTLTNLDQSRDDSLPLNFSNGPLSSSVYAPDRSAHHGHTFNRLSCFRRDG